MLAQCHGIGRIWADIKPHAHARLRCWLLYPLYIWRVPLCSSVPRCRTCPDSVGNVIMQSSMLCTFRAIINERVSPWPQIKSVIPLPYAVRNTHLRKTVLRARLVCLLCVHPRISGITHLTEIQLPVVDARFIEWLPLHYYQTPPNIR